MRFISGVIAFSLCGIAAAQTPSHHASGKPAVAVDRVATGTDAASVASAAALKTGTFYMCLFSDDSGLYTINPNNGVATYVGPTGISTMCTDLAFRKTAASGTQLFATTFLNLYKVNPATGKATALPNAYGTNIVDINALVAQPGSGILYGMGGNIPGEFVEISPTTGKATKKGTLGSDLGSAGDLAFLNGQLYGLVNKQSTGEETYLAKISLATKTMGKATDLLPVKLKEGSSYVVQDNVWGLAVRNNVLYALMESGQVLTLNPANGIATQKGDNGQLQAGLAVVP